MASSETVVFLKKLDEVVRAIPGLPYQFPPSVEGWISERNQWTLYPAPGLQTKEQATSAPLPNVYVGCYAEQWNEVDIGISYQTKPLVTTFMQLDQTPNRHIRDKILTILSSVDNRWQFVTYQKTRWDTFTTSPVYEERSRRPSNMVNQNSLASILSELRQIQNSSHKRDEIVDGRRIDYQGASFDIMYVRISYPSPDFVVCIREAFGIFEQCLQLKDEATTRRELSEMRMAAAWLETKLKEAQRMLRLPIYSEKSKKRILELAESYRQELVSIIW